MSFSPLTKWRFFVLAMACTMLIAMYGPVLIHPDNYMFSSSGDGIKNYFTFAWHIKYDSSWIDFGGMNMPFGEHVGYTDGHPLFSLLFGWIPWIKNHPVGFLNYCMLLSMIVSTVLFFAVLIQLGVRPVISAFGALGIVWMQPQLFRLEGHLALSYVWLFPLLFLFIIKWFNKGNSTQLIYASISNVIAFFIHPYLGMMTSLTLISVGLFCSVFHLKQKRFNLWNGVFIMASGALPVVMYYVFMVVSDHHLNRAKMAKGFLEYTSSYEGVFVPNHAPFRHLISQVIKVKEQTWEGWSYIGLAPMLILLFVFFMLVLRKWKLIELNKAARLIWISSIPLLLFSFGFPFKNGWEKGLDIIPFIQQFRAPGRFAWVFFYATEILAVVIVEQIVTQTLARRKFVAFMIPSLFVALMILEGWQSQWEVAVHISKSPNLFSVSLLNEDLRTAIKTLKENKTENDLLVPLPYFHYGSDFFGRHCSEEVRALSFVLSFHSGIPLMASSNPRVSLSESRSLLNFFGPESANEISESKRYPIFNSKRFILIETRDSLSMEEKIIEENAAIIFTSSDFNLRTTSEAAIDANKHNWFRDRLPAVESTMEFSNLNSMVELAKGSLQIVAMADSTQAKQGEKLFAEITLTDIDPVLLTNLFVLIQERKPDGSVIWLSTYGVGESYSIYAQKAVIRIPFTLPNQNSKVEVVFTNNANEAVKYALEDVKFFRY